MIPIIRAGIVLDEFKGMYRDPKKLQNSIQIRTLLLRQRVSILWKPITVFVSQAAIPSAISCGPQRNYQGSIELKERSFPSRPRRVSLTGMPDSESA